MNLLQRQKTMLQHIYSNKLQHSEKMYSTNTQIALTQHLQSVYPVCQQWVGEPFFRKASFEYIQEYPLREYDLTFYGAFFSKHLTHIINHKLPSNANLNHQLDCLPDLASWEWIVHQVQCGPVHSKHYFQSSFPIEAIWQAHQTKQIDDPDFQLDLKPGEYAWTVGLKDNHSWFIRAQKFGLKNVKGVKNNHE